MGIRTFKSGEQVEKQREGCAGFEVRKLTLLDWGGGAIREPIRGEGKKHEKRMQNLKEKRKEKGKKHPKLKNDTIKKKTKKED